VEPIAALAHGWLPTVDRWVAGLLIPLALWVLLNGFDDLLIDFAAIAAAMGSRKNSAPSEAELDAIPPRRMAIFVALWHEHRVIQKMLDNNARALRYENYDFFIGAYPNDAPTIAAVREAMKRYTHVHLSLCPHDGPTSKADCLNWIYQRMLLHEEEHGVRFEMILTHDAEDLIDPDALRWINYYAQFGDMVQIPVLALPTPLHEIAHGVYCDEFAEYQFRDMAARQWLGGFIPSNGVGTGFSRKALEMLAASNSNRIFEPSCLTEDYENGFRVHAMGLPQKFIPVQFRHGRVIATREYFPRRFSTAVRQRSRWVLGITLQSWEHHGLRDSMRYFYWFWRDRKSLIGNLVTPLTNLLYFYGLLTRALAAATGTEWGLARETGHFAPALATGLAIQALHVGFRIWCSNRIYGWAFASAVPIRVVAGNWINCFATCRAIWTYSAARLRGQPLRWVKTEHAYPSRAALQSDRQKLGAVLTGSQWITPDQLAQAVAEQPSGVRLGEYLVSKGCLNEDDLYAALALQNQLELGKPAPEHISPQVTRALPTSIARKWRVLPFRIAAGELYLAGSELPGEAMQNEIRRFSTLDIRFRLITPTEFNEMASEYLAPVQ
jgi:adsorption protein B